MNTIFASPICQMEELKDIFIELTAKNCNIRCRQCYINFPFNKNVKDFIKIDTIKKCLEDIKKENIRCIYLTGAEPMTHPDFNTILRLCIKKSDVCICTNASFINEKKTRFLKNVENSSDHQIMFKLSFAHYDEFKNDNIRSRGAFRQNIYALKCLEKYEFLSIITVSNYYNEPDELLISNFQEILSDINIDNAVIQITKWNGVNIGVNSGATKTEDLDITMDNVCLTDCSTSRTLTENGVFTCPFLANDYRGLSGVDFSNYSKTIRLETPFCETCIKNKDKMFTVEF